jgi:hypothetical protein
MQGDVKRAMDLELTERRGANARVYLARLRWNRPNNLLPSPLAGEGRG